ncbi:MAG: guanylate kinase [Muribaculaceae bacterium]|nr:guanylate kinase [Muribaculaceae bacterium]
MEGKLIIICAPSGSGKSTIIGRIINDERLRLAFSVSATTRPRRGEEVHGVDYYYLTEEEFKKHIENDDFAEYQEVYPGRFYGTLKSEIARINADGKNVVLDIDVLGGMNVKKIYGDHALSIFIAPPSIEVLRERLIKRGTDSMEDIERRISKAEFELGYSDKCDHMVINDDLETAVAEVHHLVDTFVNPNWEEE